MTSTRRAHAKVCNLTSSLPLPPRGNLAVRNSGFLNRFTGSPVNPFVGKPVLVFKFPRVAATRRETVALRMAAVRIRIHHDIVFLQLVAVCREMVFPRLAVRVREDSYFANGEIVFPASGCHSQGNCCFANGRRSHPHPFV